MNKEFQAFLIRMFLLCLLAFLAGILLFTFYGGVLR
jgi:uncharacterized membrane protein